MTKQIQIPKDTGLLWKLVEVAYQFYARPQKPSMVFFVRIEGMSKGILKFDAAKQKDVTSRKISYQINGGDIVKLDLLPTDTATPQFDCEHGDNVKGSLVDTNHVGDSEASVFDLMVVNPFPPATPGPVTLEIVA